MKIKITCDACSKTFERNLSEVKRNQKLGRRVFCSLGCSGKVCIENIPKEVYETCGQYLTPGNRKDEFSPFRWYLKNCIKNCKSCKNGSKICTITLQNIKDQWEKQGGRCPYTGWQLKGMIDTNHANQLPLTPDRASLDRIDSTAPMKMAKKCVFHRH